MMPEDDGDRGRPGSPDRTRSLSLHDDSTPTTSTSSKNFSLLDMRCCFAWIMVIVVR
jgi:hypothetical protein